ncbi:MAG: histidine kinase [Marinirhabdus sp.]|nr:histidine kinase [Marinirhabdus sp.]
MKRVLTTLIICFSFLLTPVGAQTLSQMEVLSTDEGLPFRDVVSITQDSLGFMWFGTSQGLLKYDGYSFKQYNSDPNNPNFISKEILTRHNTLYRHPNFIWYVANNTLFRLDIEKDVIQKFDEKQGIKGGVIELHIDQKNQVWIVSENHWTSAKANTKQYLQKFDPQNTFQVIDSVKRAKREFTKLVSDGNHNLWWTTIHGGTRRYSEKGDLQKIYNLEWWDALKESASTPATRVPTSNKLLDKINKEPINEDTNYGGNVFFDAKNTAYFFPIYGGIYKRDSLSSTTLKILDTSENITNAIEDLEGNIWFAGDILLYKMDRNGKVTDVTATMQELLDFTSIKQFFIDHDGLLWVANDNGLVKINIQPNVFKQLFRSDEKGWGNSMRSIFETKDGSVIAMCERDKILVVFDEEGNQLKSLKLSGSYPKSANPLFGARFFTTDLNEEYVYTVNESLVRIRLKDGHTTIFPEFASRLNITGPNPITTLKDGRLLFGFTLSKLTLYDPVTGTSELVFKGNSHENILHLRYFLESEDPNRIWIGTINDGLLKVNLDGRVEQHYHIGSNPPLNNNNIMTIHESEDGSLWLGSFGGGLIHLFPDEKRILAYATAQGLSNNNVVGILPFDEDYLVVSTYEGLSLFNTEQETFQNFFEEDGLTHNEFNFTSFLKARNGKYYMGGMNGVNQFNPEDLVAEVNVKPLRFTALTRYNSRQNDVLVTDFAYKDPEPITISPYDQYFQLNWTIPSYFKNHTNQYVTKLEGFEKSWFFQGTNPYVRYNKLPAGDYVLNVKNLGENNGMQENTLQIPIIVRPIFYRTWWFILLCVLSIASIMYGLYRLRVKQLLAVERLRLKISSDLHDDLGSMLSGIAMQSELLEVKANKEEKSKLQMIARLSRDAISSMRDLVWSIDNRRDRTQDLLERMEELAEELLLPKGISFHMEKEALNLNKKLSVTIKQHIFFIYKEAITNVIRHSNAENVWLNIANTNGRGVISIRDDGSCFAAKKSTGLGTSNMKLRAKEIGATIDFRQENGYEIKIELPFMV